MINTLREEYREVAGLKTLCINNTQYVLWLEEQLAAARTKATVLDKNYTDALDTIFAMAIAARGSECDIDTLEAEMKAVSTKPSGYIKHVLDGRDKTINHLRAALERCKTTFEEYVAIHKDKIVGTTTPNDAINRKIAKNQELADMCRAVLAMLERQKS